MCFDYIYLPITPPRATLPLLSLYPSNFKSSSSSFSLSTFLFFFINPLSTFTLPSYFWESGPAWSVFSLPGIIPLKKIGSPPNRYQLLIAPHFVVRFFHSLWSLPVEIFSGVSVCISWACITIVMSSYMQLTVLLSPRKQFLWCPPSPLALITFLSPLLFWSLSLSGRSMIFMFYLRLSIPQFLILCS